MKGGAVESSRASEGERKGLKFGFGSFWGFFSVLSVLGNAIKRLAPVALEPFQNGSATLSPTFWAGYMSFVGYMAYTEGYKAFQQKFSRLVVRRAMTLDEGEASPLRLLLAGPYSMGLFGATKKRKIVSWSITTGVVVLVQIVKRLPYPWRSLVDAGVVAGLTWGSISMCVIYGKSLFGHIPEIDPAIPEKEEK